MEELSCTIFDGEEISTFTYKNGDYLMNPGDLMPLYTITHAPYMEGRAEMPVEISLDNVLLISYVEERAKIRDFLMPVYYVTENNIEVFAVYEGSGIGYEPADVIELDTSNITDILQGVRDLHSNWKYSKNTIVLPVVVTNSRVALQKMNSDKGFDKFFKIGVNMPVLRV